MILSPMNHLKVIAIGSIHFCQGILLNGIKILTNQDPIGNMVKRVTFKVGTFTYICLVSQLQGEHSNQLTLF